MFIVTIAFSSELIKLMFVVLLPPPNSRITQFIYGTILIKQILKKKNIVPELFGLHSRTEIFHPLRITPFHLMACPLKAP